MPHREAASGLFTLNEDQIAERGARMARRDDREYRKYLREEQRSQPGCPAREVVLDQREQATLMSFEELHGAFVPLGGSTRCERPEIAAFPGLGILLSRVQAVAARCQLSNHRRGRTHDGTTRGCTLHGGAAIPERQTASGSESSSCWKFRNARSSSREAAYSATSARAADHRSGESARCIVVAVMVARRCPGWRHAYVCDTMTTWPSGSEILNSPRGA